MAWRLARSLATLLAEVNQRWPERDRSSDGTIGDPAHAARTSDHNPNAAGVVRAADFDSSGGVGRTVADHVRSLGARGIHPALGHGAYVIFDRRIASADRAWTWREYSGSNPHTTHVHVSVSSNAAGYDSSTGWGLVATRTPWPLPSWHSFGRNGRNRVTLHDGRDLADRQHIRRIQTHLGVAADGLYGPATATAVMDWQRRRGIEPHGRVTSREWRRLGL